MGRRPYHRSRRGPTEEERGERGGVVGERERGLGAGCGAGCAVAMADWLLLALPVHPHSSPRYTLSLPTSTPRSDRNRS